MSISLTSGLVHLYHKQILLVDTDNQNNKVLLEDNPSLRGGETIYATTLDRNPLRIRGLTIPNIDVVPFNILLSNTNIELTTALDHREARLKTEMNRIRG